MLLSNEEFLTEQWPHKIENIIYIIQLYIYVYT